MSPQARITFKDPRLTVEIHDRGVRITATDRETGQYVSDWSLWPGEARRMGQALIQFADELEGQKEHR